MFLRTSPARHCRISITWLLHWLRHLIGLRRARFLPLFPPSFIKQRLYDRHSHQTIDVVIETDVEWQTFAQIFYAEDYSLNKLTRHDDLIAQYNEMVRRCVSPLILDCGGNVGFAARYFSETFT